MASKLCLLAFGVLVLARTAGADPDTYYVPSAPPDIPAESYGWTDPRLSSGIGVGMILGGGVGGFTDQSMRNALSSNVEGLWDARLSLGTHIPLGLDLSYLGEAADLRTFTGQANGTLVGTTAEAALRWNMLPHAAVNPYIFAGIGWQRYDVSNMAFATADTGIANSDNLVEVPMGVGFSYRDRSGLLVDVRGTFRAVPSSTLVVDPSGTYASANWWEASAALGYEL